MQTMEEIISEHVSTIKALTEDQSRDVVPIMADIRREAELIEQALNEGDPYVSGDDVELSPEDAARMQADRKRDDLAARDEGNR